jgi:hypothetical protein
MSDEIRSQITTLLSNVNGWPSNDQIQSYIRANVLWELCWIVFFVLAIIISVIAMVKLVYKPYKKVKNTVINENRWNETVIDSFSTYCRESMGYPEITFWFLIITIIILAICLSVNVIYFIDWLSNPNGMVINNFIMAL